MGLFSLGSVGYVFGISSQLQGPALDEALWMRQAGRSMSNRDLGSFF